MILARPRLSLLGAFVLVNMAGFLALGARPALPPLASPRTHRSRGRCRTCQRGSGRQSRSASRSEGCEALTHLR
jgi:hypothetical protein